MKYCIDASSNRKMLQMILKKLGYPCDQYIIIFIIIIIIIIIIVKLYINNNYY